MATTDGMESDTPAATGADLSMVNPSQMNANQSLESRNRLSERSLAVAITTAAVITVLVSRTWVAAAAVLPKGMDVLGPWAAAFQIAGESPAIDMFDLPTYSVAMGAVLAPLVILVDEPTLRYQIAIYMVGLFPIGAGWFTTRYIRRVTDWSPLALSVSFAVPLLLVSVSLTSSVTWAEPLVLLYLTGWLALMSLTVAKGNIAWSAGLAAFSGLGYLVHGRLVLLPFVWVLAVAVMGLEDRRRGKRDTRWVAVETITVLLCSAIALYAARRFGSAVISAAWSKPNYSSESAFSESVDTMQYWFAALRAAVGQMWYLVTSTAGLAVVGAVVLGKEIRQMFGGASDISVRRGRLASIGLLALLSVIATSILSITPGTIDTPARADYLIYGRYVDQVGVVLAAIGGLGLLEFSRKRVRNVQMVSVSLMILLVFTMKLIRDSTFDAPVPLLESVISGVSTWPFARQGLDVVRWTLIGAILGCLLLAFRYSGRRQVAAVVVILLLAGSVAASHTGVEIHGRWDNSVLYEGYPPAAPGLERVLVAEDALAGTAYKYNSPSQQYYLASTGWDFLIVPESSAELSSSTPPDTGMVVLLHDTPPPGGNWCQMPPYSNVKFWARISAGIPGTPGGACQLTPP